jgi:hypothetical protein
MKTKILTLKNCFILFLFLITNFSCEKREKAGIYLAAIIGNVSIGEIKTTEAKLTSEITAASANSAITDFGFCYDVVDKVAIETSKKVSLGAAATDKMPISTVLTGLKPKTKYFVRAYLTDAKQTNYSAQSEFTTADLQPPKVSTSDGGEIGQKGFSISGKITEIGTSDVTQYGHVTSETNKEPTTGDLSTKLGTSNTAPKDFKSVFTDLNPGTTYYIRAYATNVTGTTYSEVKTIKTLNPIPPTMASSDLGSSGPTKVSAFGSFKAFGSSTVVKEYGFVTSETNKVPTLADSRSLTTGTPTLNSIFQTNIINLKPNTTYYLRAFGTTNDGTGYGDVLTFKTPDYTPPTFGVIPQPDKNYCSTYLADWYARKIDYTKTFDGYCFAGTSFYMPPQVKVSFTYTASPDDEVASLGVCVIPNSQLYLASYQPTVTDSKIDNSSKGSVWNSTNNFQGTFNHVTFTTTNQTCEGKRFYSNYFISPFQPNFGSSILSLSYAYRPYIIGKSGKVYYGATQKYSVTTTASPYCLTLLN